MNLLVSLPFLLDLNNGQGLCLIGEYLFCGFETFETLLIYLQGFVDKSLFAVFVGSCERDKWA